MESQKARRREAIRSIARIKKDLVIDASPEQTPRSEALSCQSLKLSGHLSRPVGYEVPTASEKYLRQTTGESLKLGIRGANSESV
jgi:hypothetical protein